VAQLGVLVLFSLTFSPDRACDLFSGACARYFFALPRFNSSCVVALIVKLVKEGRLIRAGNTYY